jgi:hypothetical protein
MFALGFFIILFPLLLAIPVISARIHLKPLRELARQRRLPIQFALTDILLLLAMLGVSGSVLASIPDSLERSIALIILWVALGVSWYYAVRLVSQAGVAAFNRRFWIIALAVPFAIFGFYLLLMIPGAFSTSSMILNSDGGYSIQESRIRFFWLDWKVSNDNAELIRKALLSAWIFTGIAWIFVPRRLARWAISDQGYVPPPHTSELPPAPSDAPLLDPHVKDLKLK